MVLVHITVKNQIQANEIIELLMDKKLLADALVSEKMILLKVKGSEKTKQKKIYLIIGKTKALLFKTINEILYKKYPDKMPILYAVPIVYMDDGQTEELRMITAKI